MNDINVIDVVRNVANQNKDICKQLLLSSNNIRDICQHLLSLQLQIQALVAVLPKDKQDEWFSVLNTLGNKQSIDIVTGEPLQKV